MPLNEPHADHSVKGDEPSAVSPPRIAPRGMYRTSAHARPGALLVTLLVHALVIVVLVARWTPAYVAAKPSAPLSITLLPLAAPSPPEAVEKEKPIPERQTQKPPEPPIPVPRVIQPPVLPVPLPPPPEARSPDPNPRPVEDASPRTAPAPPAPQPKSNAPDSWEGRVLARIEKVRRYPGAARTARQQGVVHIRFHMNREGRLLSSSIMRGSGFPLLDQAALDTVRRAEPLPKIPADRPDELDLVVPVEFYIR